MDIKNLIHKINELESEEKKYLLKLLENDNLHYTLNKNGYFFNLQNISENLKSKLFQAIKFIEINRKKLQEFESQRQTIMTKYIQEIKQHIKEKNEAERLAWITFITKQPLNIQCIISRHIKIKDMRSIEYLLKEYKSSKKINKDSIYGKLDSRMKILSKTKKQIMKIESNYHNEEEEHSIHDVDDDDKSINEIEETEIEEYDLIEDDEQIIDNHSAENVLSIEDEEDIETTDEQDFELIKKIEHYKTALINKGYLFNYHLKMENYII